MKESRLADVVHLGADSIGCPHRVLASMVGPCLVLAAAAAAAQIGSDAKAVDAQASWWSLVLKHPITIVATTAVLSGLLVPFLMRQSQERQKELELQTQLVSQISEAVMSIVLAVQFVRLNRGRGTAALTKEDLTKRQEEFDAVYRKWEIDAAIIGSKLEAYFAGSPLPTTWTQFASAVTDFYALEGQTEDQQDRSLADLGVRVGKLTSGYVAPDWQSVRGAILDAKARLSRSVLGCTAPAFHTRIFRSLARKEEGCPN
jgi:hypothetical protein